MQKIKILSVLFLVAILMPACSEYQKVLNKGDADTQYKMGTALFEEGNYKKSIALFEKVIPAYQRKPQLERIQYMVAMANYETKSYNLAAYYFNRFIGNYPKSSKLEEATFLTAHSYYLGSPKSSLDQADTQKALTSFQNFIDKYPDSERVADANKYYVELGKRLEKKAFDNAKLYYTTENYKAAITAFDIFIEDNFGTEYKEEALAFKFLASYELGMKSVFSKKQQRLDDAIIAFGRFEKSYPESSRIDEFKGLVEDVNKEIELTKEIQEKIDNNGL